MKWLEHIEVSILVLTPIVGIIALVNNFSWSNLLLFCILMILWKIGNSAL